MTAYFCPIQRQLSNVEQMTAYIIPKQHAAIYPAQQQTEVLNSAITSYSREIKKTRHLTLPRDFWHFDQLIKDNIDFVLIEKQMKNN